MKDTILWRKNKRIDEMSFNAFMRVVTKQAKQLQRERGLPMTQHKCKISHEVKIRYTVAGQTKNRFRKLKRFI